MLKRTAVVFTAALTIGASAAPAHGLVHGGAVAPKKRASKIARVALPAVLKRIARCESGGDPRAVSSNGMYRGKFQFARATWRAMGGKGDPARAPERVQDRLALKLYRQAGTSPWPVCGG